MHLSVVGGNYILRSRSRAGKAVEMKTNTYFVETNDEMPQVLSIIQHAKGGRVFTPCRVYPGTPCAEFAGKGFK